MGVKSAQIVVIEHVIFVIYQTKDHKNREFEQEKFLQGGDIIIIIIIRL